MLNELLGMKVHRPFLKQKREPRPCGEIVWLEICFKIAFFGALFPQLPDHFIWRVELPFEPMPRFCLQECWPTLHAMAPLQSLAFSMYLFLKWNWSHSFWSSLYKPSLLFWVLHIPLALGDISNETLCYILATDSSGDVGSEWAWELADLGSNPSPTNN